MCYPRFLVIKMYLKLLYTFFLIAATLVVSSCSSTEPAEPAEGAEVMFDVAGRSRASVISDINFEGSQFAVFGDMKIMNSDNPLTIFDGATVTFNNGNWTYNDTQYWYPQHEHSFVAVYPESIKGTGSNVRYSDSHLSFTYSIPTTDGYLTSNSDVKDILVATHRRFYEKSESGSTESNRITFSFKHILSLINIKPAFNNNKMTSDSYILFHDMKLSGVSKKALFDIHPASILAGSQTDDMTIGVTGQEEVGDVTIVFNTPVKVKNDANNVSLFADNDELIMLPQIFTDDSESEITLSYTINEDTEMNSVTLPLKNLKWESGKSYTYKFTIEMSGVIFDINEINPWNVIQGDEEITAD